MNVLVTGVAGYVGSVCASELVRQKFRVTGYDNLSKGHHKALPRGIHFVEGEVGDERKLLRVLKDNRIEAVFHFAASALIDESIRSPKDFYQNNVQVTLTLLGTCLRTGVRDFIFSSSAAVYGEPRSVPISEDHPCEPMNPYGETKLVIERVLRWYHNAYGLRAMALRYFSAAGATLHQGEDHRPETHLLPRLLGAAIDPEEQFVIYGDDYPTRDGTCIRDFVHVVDIAQAHILAMRKLSKIGFGIYNVGSGEGYSIREVVKAVEKVTGRTVRVRVGGRRPGDPAILVASSAKLRKDLGWKPRSSVLSSIVMSAYKWRSRFPSGYPESEGRG